MKRFLLFLMVAVFVVMSGGALWADMIMDENWGDVWGDGEADSLGVQEIIGDPSYYTKPQGYGPGSSIPLALTGGEFLWSTFPVDAVVIRTTQSSGSLTGGYTPLSASFKWNREAEEMEIGTFDVDIDSGSLTYSWDFTGVDDRVLVGYLSALSNDVEVASLDHVVVKLEENPTFDIFAAVKVEDEVKGQTLRSFNPVNGEVDLGLWLTNSKNDIMAYILNFWDEAVTVSDDVTVDNTLFGPGFYDDERPPVISVPNRQQIDPGLAGVIELPWQENSLDVSFINGETLSLSWLRAYSFLDDGPNDLGMMRGITSENLSDINDDIEPDVAYVVNMAEDQLEYPYGIFSIVTSADSGNYIAQIDVVAGVPSSKRDDLSVYPLGIRLAIDVDQVAVYSEELDSAISEEFGDELPTENQITEAVRKHVAFTKEWSDGTTAEIQLDDEDFKDAVDIWVEFDDKGEAEFVFLTVNLLIVNGGEPGMVDSAIVNDRQYIVIYDGELDDKFADPLKLTAATVESDDGDSTTSGGGGGCSALGFVPGVALLFLPLWMLSRK